MDITITLDADQSKLYKEAIASILSVDTFSPDCIGQWARGCWHTTIDGETRWLLVEEDEAEAGTERAAISDWTNGQDLPKGYHYFNRDQAEKILALGLLQHGIGFIDGETDANDLDTIIQLVMLGEYRYC